MDTKQVYDKLIQAGFMSTKLKPISKNQMLIAQDTDIVRYFRNVAQGFLSYYRCCDNLNKVKTIALYWIKFSLIYTLANKHKLRSAKKVIDIYGKDLTVSNSKETISYLSDTSTSNLHKEFLINHTSTDTIDLRLSQTYLNLQNSKIFSNTCAVKGCETKEGIEIHHIRKLHRGSAFANGKTMTIVKGRARTLSKIEAIESALKRKQITLCRKHHSD